MARIQFGRATSSRPPTWEHPAGTSGLEGDAAVPWLRVTGPGRLATCSVFGEGGYEYNVHYHSEATSKVW
jgi:hypothetical protein